jgi:hypothetical protein
MMMKKMILILLLAALLPFQAIANKSSKAKIVTQNERTAQCISSVVIDEVDGRLSNVAKQGFELDAGTHSMSGRAIINTANCPAIRGRNSYVVPDLEADFEAGKTYYVGLDHSSKNKEEWRLVVWKTE